MFVQYWCWFVVVASTASVFGGDLSAIDTDFTRGHEVQANTFTSSSQSDASIASLNDGGFAVVWHSRRQQEGTYGVYLQRFATDGKAIGGEKQINLFAKNMQMKPAIATSPHGDVWVAWESFGQDGSLNAIVARRFSKDGMVGGDEILVNQSTKGNQSDVVIAFPKPGQVTFYWGTHTSDFKRKCIVGRTFGNDGKPLTDERIVCDSQRHQSLPCVDSIDGQSVVVWAEQDQHGRPAGIFGQTISTAEDKPARKFRVDSASHNSGIEPAVCMGANGSFAVSWLESVGNKYKVMVRQFDQDAVATSDAVQVSEPKARYVSGAAIESGPDNRFIVAWNQQTDDMGKDINIFGQLFDSAGKRDGSILRINKNHSGRHRLTAVSGKRRIAWDHDSGQLCLVWHGHNDVDGSSVNVTAYVKKDQSFVFSRPANSSVAQEIETARPHDPPTFNPKLIAEDPFGGFAPLGPAGGDFGFNAINSTGWNPPDPVVAAGPNHVIAMTNGAIAFFDKTGMLTFSDQIEGAGGFWGAQGAGGFVFDPEVLWDPHSNRYFAMANERSGNLSFFLIAVSDDDDPNGNWFKYRLDVTNIADANIDSPNFAVDDEVVYLTADFFGPDRFLVYMLRKSDLLVGDPVVDTNLLITGSQSYGVPMTYDADAPAFYMIQAFEFGNFSTIRLHAITDQLGNPQRVTTDVAVPSYGHPQDPPQQGTSSRPELFEARFWSCVYRNGSLWAVHHHSPNSSGVVRARWYEFAMNDWPASGQTPQLVQSGEITDTNDSGQISSIFFPSIWVDDLGNAAITTARSSNSEFISMSRSVRSVNDPPDTFQDLELVQASTTSFTGGRWGDYSGTSDDPVEASVFWGIHEYALTPGIWRTYIARYVVHNASVTIAPSSVFADVGSIVSGGFLDLEQADGDAVVANADASKVIDGQGLSFQLSGSSIDTEFNSLRVVVAASVNTPNLIQEVELFNFVNQEFQLVDSRVAGVDGSSVEIEVPGNVTEFVTPGSGTLLARVRFKPIGPTLYFPWRASLDQFVWEISD